MGVTRFFTEVPPQNKVNSYILESLRARDSLRNQNENKIKHPLTQSGETV